MIFTDYYDCIIFLILKAIRNLPMILIQAGIEEAK
jgi:hypothetical protein